MTEIVVNAHASAIIGARTKSERYTPVGIRSSLRNNLMPSTSGCSKPKGPHGSGPQRFWMRPTTLRSSSTVYATPSETRPADYHGLQHA